MDSTRTIWLQMLEPLRGRLSGRDHRGSRGSLRWLEALVAEHGGRAGAVRNILYKDLGSFDEKSRLYEVLVELHQEVGLPPPGVPGKLSAARAKQVLGSDKRAIFARFARGLKAGETPQVVVVGGNATGKSVLIEQVRQWVGRHLFVSLAHDLAPGLFGVTEPLGLTAAVDRLIAQLSPTQPYALQASLQQEITTALAHGLNQAGLPLLLRAESKATLDGLPLRGPDSGEVDLSAWVESLLVQLEIPYLVALSTPTPSLPYQELRRPNRQESRRYLRQKLPETSDERLEELLNQAGRDYGELSRMVLLEMSRDGQDDNVELLKDPHLGPVLRILAVLSPDSDPLVPVRLFELTLGKRIDRLNQAQRALLEWSGKSRLRPSLRSLLPDGSGEAELHRLALDYYRENPNLFRQLHHAKHSRSFTELIELLRADPLRLTLLPGLWAEAAEWPPEAREELAPVVLRQRAVLGDYGHPEVKQAIGLLAASSDPRTASWVRLKLAEARIEAGQFDEAATIVEALPEMSGEAKAEALLVKAALARWQGHYELADAIVGEALDLAVPPLLLNRALLWRGLVAKDAGRFDEALESLARVSHNPLLTGRARYQEGDLLMRLGKLAPAAERLEEAMSKLEASASPEEVARVRARSASALRRLGRYQEAAHRFELALKEAPNPFTHFRIASEASVLAAARGRPLEAMQLAGEAERFFKSTDLRPEEAKYRHLRTLYRLGVAYRVCQSGEPFRPPFRHVAFGGHATAILRPLLDEVRPLAASADRYASLYLDAAIALSQLIEPAEAERLLEPLLSLTQEYLRWPARLAYASVLNRHDSAREAMVALAGLRNLPPDPGLLAWKAAVEAETLLLVGEADVATAVIDEALTLPKVFRQQLGRVWGRTLLESGHERLACRWSIPAGPFALPDALGITFAEADQEGEPTPAAATPVGPEIGPEIGADVHQEVDPDADREVSPPPQPY